MSAVTTLMQHMATSHRTVWNRTEMHSSVRGATELLQQEVGQAGLVALPGAVALTGAVPSKNLSPEVGSAMTKSITPSLLMSAAAACVALNVKAVPEGD